MKYSSILAFLFITLIPFKSLANGEVISPNMNLPVPAVGITTGPAWADDINQSLNLIDSHDHSPGKGVQITPAGININSDLSCGNNNLINPRTVRFSPQSNPLTDPTDLGAIYESGVDLYYRDGNGNNIRLTQSGSIVGTSGTISGLVSPASASYVSGTSTFVWESAINTSANLDASCLIQRNITAGSNGITLCAPAALASNYSLTWPGALPASQKFATIDNSGNIAAPWAVDNSTIEISSNTVQVKPQGVTQGLLALRTTGTTVGAGGIAISASTGSYSNTGTSFTTAATVTITTTGRPVVLALQDDGNISSSSSIGNNGSASALFAFFRGATQITKMQLGPQAEFAPPGMINFIDTPAAGTYTYTLQATLDVGGGGRQVSINNCKMVAYEQ